MKDSQCIVRGKRGGEATSLTLLGRLNGKSIFIGIAALLVSSCATGVSQYQRSYDVSVQFEKGQVLPNHRYYVGGPKLKPNAIVALIDHYRLEAEDWREVKDLTPGGLKALVDMIAQVDGAEYKERQHMHNGARIYYPDGRQVGVWYSVYDYSQIRFLGDNRIYLSYPPSQLPPGVRIPRFERDLPWRN